MPTINETIKQVIANLQERLDDIYSSVVEVEIHESKDTIELKVTFRR